MQVLVVFFLAALVGAHGDRSECLDKAESCMDFFVNRNNGEVSETKICREATKAVECLENSALESCVGDESEDKVKSDLERIKQRKDRACNQQGSPSDYLENCVQEHEEYISACISESMEEVFGALGNQDLTEADEDRIKCGMFMSTGRCVLDKITEKCGIEAAMEAMTLMSDVSDEIREACKSIGVLLGSRESDDDERKK